MMIHPDHREHGTALKVIAALLALLAAIGILLLISPRSALAQSGVRSAAIVLTLGNDTLVVERIQRGDRNVTAFVAVKGQPTNTIHYTLGPDHRIVAGTYQARGFNAPSDAEPLQTAAIHFERDTAVLEIRGGGTTRDLRLGTRPGALPITNNEFVVMEQAVRMARAQGVQRLTIPLFLMSGGQTMDGTIELVGSSSDTARFTVAGNVTEATIDAEGNITGGRLPGQNIAISVVTGAAAMSVSLGRPDYGAAKGAPYTSEEIVVNTPAGHQLTGTLTLPAKAAGARVPAVITITGSGAQDRDEFIPIGTGYRLFRQVADTLTRRGIAVLRLDDRGIGGSGGDVNGTSADFADDIRAAVAHLRARVDIDPARIALVGHSEGGAIAPIVASTDARLAAIVLLAGPAYTGREIIDYQIANGLRANSSLNTSQRDSAIRADRAAFDSTAGRTPWMKWFLAYDPKLTARKVRQPVLILHGATDQQVRQEEATILDRELRAAGNRRVTTRIFPDRNHLFLRDADGHPSGYARLTDAKVDGEVMGALADWLVTTLGVR